MTILIFAIIVLIVAGLLLYAIDLAPPLAPFAGLIKIVIILITVLVILNGAGLL